MTNKEILANRIKNAEEAIAYSTTKLCNAPEGKLNIRHINGVDRYYLRQNYSRQNHSRQNHAGKSNAENKYITKEKYLGKNNESTIKKLQEKEYYEKLKRVAEKELAALKKIRNIENSLISSQSVFQQIPVKRRNMIQPYISKSEEEVRKKIETERRYWEKDKLDRRGIDRKIQLTTLNGERVRSKSELIIADRLKLAGIPYYFEGKVLLVVEEISHDIMTWFPDFQMFNVRTGEKFYWEHFGIMDNPEYCASCQYKLETYAKYGIVMGKNLIVTMESSQHSLNTQYVDCLIKEFLK